MPIATFENRKPVPLTLVVEPWGDRFEIPHLGEAGIRYALKAGEEDRSTSVVGEDEIQFWCNAERYEVDVVEPSPADRLLWAICVRLGFCGGIVEGEPCFVEDLLPETGPVGAAQFALLAIRADGASEPEADSYLPMRRRLEAMFAEHFGPDPVPVERLKSRRARPFDAMGPGG